MFLGFILILAVLVAAGYGYLSLPTFGDFPEGARLRKIEASPNYRDGEFRNIEPLPVPAKKRGAVEQLASYLMTTKDRPRPPGVVPSVKTDLAALAKNNDVVIWFGHSYG